MDQRNLGDLGEDDFKRWCSQAGIAANKSARDRTGWDYFVEVPGAGAPAGPFMARTDASCLVQVKATDEFSGVLDGTALSVWWRLVNQPIPAFILVLGYSGGLEPVAAALVHLDAQRVRDVFDTIRARKLAPDELHRHSKRLRWKDEDLLEPLNGRGLREALVARIGSSQREYVAAKLGWIRQAASVNARVNTRFSLGLASQGKPEEESYRELVDFSLGLSEEVAVRTEFFEVDGRPPFEGVPSGSTGTLRLSRLRAPPAGDALVSVFTLDGVRRAAIACQYYTPGGMFPFIPPEYWRVRYRGRCVEFLHNLSDPISLDMKLHSEDLEDLHPLAELRQASNLLHVIDMSGGKVGFAVDIDGTRVLAGEAEVGDRLDIPSAWKNATDLVEFAWSVAVEMGASTESMTCWASLEDQEQQIRLVRTLLLRPDLMMHVDSWVDFDQKSGGGKLGWPVLAAFRLGHEVLCVAAALHGEPTFTGEQDEGGFKKWRLDCPAVSVVQRVVWAGSELPESEIRRLKLALEKWFDDQGMGWVRGEEWPSPDEDG